MERKWSLVIAEYMKDGYAVQGGTSNWHNRTAKLVKGERVLEIEIEVNSSIPYVEVRRGGKIKSVSYF